DDAAASAVELRNRLRPAGRHRLDRSGRGDAVGADRQPDAAFSCLGLDRDGALVPRRPSFVAAVQGTQALVSSTIELGVKSDVATFEIELAQEGGGLGGAMLAVHAGVFPFDAERALVVHIVQGNDDLLKVDVAP